MWYTLAKFPKGTEASIEQTFTLFKTDIVLLPSAESLRILRNYDMTGK